MRLTASAAVLIAVAAVSGAIGYAIGDDENSATATTGGEDEQPTDWWEVWEDAQQNNAQPPCLDVPSTHPSMAPPSPDGEAYATDADGRVTWVNPCVVTSGWTIQGIEWVSPDDSVTCFYNGASEWLCSPL